MSWLARLRSKSIEALNSSMTLAGPAANRPPHIVLLMRPSTRKLGLERRSKTHRAGDLFLSAPVFGAIAAIAAEESCLCTRPSAAQAGKAAR